MLRRLLSRLSGRASAPSTPDPAAATDYSGDRESARRAQLTQEERDWEAASRQRNQERERETETGTDAPPAP